MGLDWIAIAAPLDADPVRAIRADPALWETAEVRPPFARPRPGETLPEISQQLLAVVPDGTGWADHFGDRSHQQAAYLLDPAGYRTRAHRQESHQQSLTYRIIQGDQTFAGHATSGQGIPWRCSTTDFLTSAVTVIDNLDVAGIRREFSVAEMHELGVYKVHPEEDDDHAFTRILSNVRALRQYYQRAIDQNLDVIITLF